MEIGINLGKISFFILLNMIYVMGLMRILLLFLVCIIFGMLCFCYGSAPKYKYELVTTNGHKHDVWLTPEGYGISTENGKPTHQHHVSNWDVEMLDHTHALKELDS